MYGVGLQVGLQSGKGINGFKRGQLRNDRKSLQNTFEVFRSGNWNDPQIWRKNGQATNQVPNIRSQVYVPTNFTLTINTNATVDRIFSLGSIVFDSTARSLTINNDCLIYGALNMSTSNAAHILGMNGVNNYINPSLFVTGTGSTVIYGTQSSVNILALTYRNLQFSNGGVKTFVGNTTVTGTTIINRGTLSNALFIENNGNVLFTGNLSFGANIVSITFSRGDFEFKGGITGGGGNTPIFFSSTINSLSFTETQTINSSGSNNNIHYQVASTISDTKTVTFSGTAPHILYENINGLGASATLNNNGNLQIQQITMPMSTGVFNYMNTAGSMLVFGYNGNLTLPYTTYANLGIGGSGIKTLGGNTTCNASVGSFDYVLGAGSSNIITTSELQLSNFNFLCSSGNNNFSARLSKNSLTGTTIFVGQLITTFGGTNCNYNFQSGYEIELRGGLLFSGTASAGLTFRFTTNNQTYNTRSNSETYNLLIDNVTVTYSTTETIFSGTINGTNSSSIFDCRGTFDYRSDSVIMVTGLFRTDQAANTFIYNKTGTAQVIRVPDDGNYRNLTLTGNTSTKTVGGGGTTNARGTYTLNAGVTVVGTITNIP